MGSAFTFADWSFEVFHMPGHTWWALGLAGEVDGTRVALTGDNLLAGALSPLRASAPIYRNRMRIDSIAAGVRRLIDFEPELLLTGHTGALEVTRPMLDDFLAWARQLEGVFTRLCAVPERVNEALDPDFVVCFPYLSPDVTAGRAARASRSCVTNHGSAAARTGRSCGWSCRPAGQVEPAGRGRHDRPGATDRVGFSDHARRPTNRPAGDMSSSPTSPSASGTTASAPRRSSTSSTRPVRTVVRGFSSDCKDRRR